MVIIFPNNYRLSVYYGRDLEFLWNVTDDNFGGAYMVISTIVDYFNLINFPRVKILKTKDSVQSMPLCIYYRKHSCLVRPFNEQIFAYQTGGLDLKWAMEYQKPQYLKYKRHMESKALSFDQINGLIIVCIFCYVISIIVFILELMSTSHGSIKILLDFLTFKSKQKRPRRHNSPNHNLKLINLNSKR